MRGAYVVISFSIASCSGTVISPDASVDATTSVDAGLDGGIIAPATVLEAAVSTAGGNPAPSVDYIDFGLVYERQTRVVPVLITNRSGAARSLATVRVFGPSDVTVERFTPTTLETCAATPCTSNSVTWIAVRWVPSALGSMRGTVRIDDDAGTPLRTIEVTGMAIALGEVANVTSAEYAGGARCDSGATDSTEAFRAAAASGRIVYVPACAGHYQVSGPIQITGPGVIGEPGGERPLIRMVGADGGFDGTPSPHTMFALSNHPGPVLFTGLHLDGQWDGTLPGGEWDHLIELRAADDVTIENNILESPWGDCVYVGGGFQPPSERLLVVNNVMRNPWRCTLAFISVDDARVLYNVLEKPNGGPRGDVWYHFNLDFEPNPNPDEADWNVEVAFNEFSSHVPPSRYEFDVGIAVIMSHASDGLPLDGFAGGNLGIHDNSGTAGTFLQPSGYNNGTDFWMNVSAYRNFNPNGCFPPLADCP